MLNDMLKSLDVTTDWKHFAAAILAPAAAPAGTTQQAMERCATITSCVKLEAPKQRGLPMRQTPPGADVLAECQVGE